MRLGVWELLGYQEAPVRVTENSPLRACLLAFVLVQTYCPVQLAKAELERLSMEGYEAFILIDRALMMDVAH